MSFGDFWFFSEIQFIARAVRIVADFVGSFRVYCSVRFVFRPFSLDLHKVGSTTFFYSCDYWFELGFGCCNCNFFSNSDQPGVVGSTSVTIFILRPLVFVVGRSKCLLFGGDKGPV